MSERERERERERLDLFSIHNRSRMQIDVDSIPVLTNFKTIHLQVHVQVNLRQYNMIPYSGKLSREKTFTDWRLRSDHFAEKLSRNAKTYHTGVQHAQISWRKLSLYMYLSSVEHVLQEEWE